MLDRDLANSPLILEKVKNDEYAQKLYAAMCNMRWRKVDDPTIGLFAVTWRTAGGIVADLRDNNETYLDWYCSGSEGQVTEEIEQDLLSLGWVPVEYEEF